MLQGRVQRPLPGAHQLLPVLDPPFAQGRHRPHAADQQQLDDRRFVEGDVDVGLHRRLHLGRQRRAADERLVNGLEQEGGRLLEQVDEQRFLVGEVEVEGADGHVGFADDVAHRGGVVSFLGKDAHRGLHHGRALGVFLAAGLLGAAVGHADRRYLTGVWRKSQRDPTDH